MTFSDIRTVILSYSCLFTDGHTSSLGATHTSTQVTFLQGNKRPNFVLCLTSYMDAGNLNLSLHVCMASTLPSKPAPYFSSPAHFLDSLV